MNIFNKIALGAYSNRIEMNSGKMFSFIFSKIAIIFIAYLWLAFFMFILSMCQIYKNQNVSFLHILIAAVIVYFLIPLNKNNLETTYDKCDSESRSKAIKFFYLNMLLPFVLLLILLISVVKK
jgi:hypothetical protein